MVEASSTVQELSQNEGVIDPTKKNGVVAESSCLKPEHIALLKLILTGDSTLVDWQRRSLTGLIEDKAPPVGERPAPSAGPLRTKSKAAEEIGIGRTRLYEWLREGIIQSGADGRIPFSEIVRVRSLAPRLPAVSEPTDVLIRPNDDASPSSAANQNS